MSHNFRMIDGRKNRSDQSQGFKDAHRNVLVEYRLYT